MVIKLSSSQQPADAAAEEPNELDWVLKLLHWTGMMRHPHAGPWASRVHYVIHALSMLALVLFDFSLVVLLFQEGAADLEQFTLTLSVLTTIGFFTLRLWHIAAKEPEFHTLVLRVRRDCDEFLGAGDLLRLRQGGGGMRRVLLAYQWSLVLTAVAYSTVPVNADGLPFVMALPYDATQPIAYECTWLFCTYIVFCAHIGTMVADSFSVTVILQLHNQLDQLGRNLRSLSDSISHMKSSSFQALNMKNAPNSDTSHDIHSRFRKSVLHHQAIIRNVQLLEECLGRMLLGQCLTNGTSFCLQLFQAATRTKGVQELGKTCTYLVAASSMLFIYCWYGDDLISESEKLALSAYDAVTSLQACPTPIKRSLLLLMVRAQRPLQLTAGGFFALSRESFVAVLNASYSFFAILRNFKEEQ